MGQDPEMTDDPGATDDPEVNSSRSQWWELAAAVILSLATVSSAWSSYQAARWSGDTTVSNRAATTARFDATKLSNVVNRRATTDVTSFAVWLEATIRGDHELADALADRFQPELSRSFEAWRSASNDQVPPGTPFDRPDYVLNGTAEIDALLNQAEDHAKQADEATSTVDRYVLTAVLYASVLFFAGIASKLTSTTASHLAVMLSGAMFVIATGVVISLPMNT